MPHCDGNLTNPSYNEPFLNFTIPYNTKDGSWDGCHRYHRRNNHHSCLPEDYNQNSTEECPEGKAFSTDIYSSTLVSEVGMKFRKFWFKNA